MWNQEDAKHYYNNVELMAQRWQEQQETYAPSFEVQTPEHVATQLAGELNASAASAFEMALLQTIMMHQQRSQPQQQVQEQQQQQQLLQQQLQQQQLHQLQQMQQMQQLPLSQLQQLQQLMLLQQQMQPAQQLFLEAAMGHGQAAMGRHQSLPSNQVFDPEAHQAPESHEPEAADLERCYSQAVSAFLNQEDEDEEEQDNDGDAGTNVDAQTETNYEEPVASKQDAWLQEAEKKSRRARSTAHRLHCSFHLSEAYLHYKVVPAIIGKGGENTRAIFATTGAKVRVRGRGSGHQEAGSNMEAPTGPMVTVSTTSETSFDDAVRQTCRLLLSVQEKMAQLNPGIKDALGDLCQYASMHDGRSFRLTENGMVEEDSAALKLRGKGRPKWRGV